MFFYGFDPLYFLFILPAAALGIYAQFKVMSAFNAAKQIQAASGVTGAEAAAVILRQAGLLNVEAEQADGFLSDHYDPRAKVLRLSPDVYGGRSLAAVGIAAHEAGHAIQDATGYGLLVVRNAIVPLASFGGGLSMILLMVGLWIHLAGMVWLGIVLFSVVVFFQLVNLPVEFDASRRAKEILPRLGLLRGEEEEAVVRRVLSAAALTYVAATLMAVMQLLYFLSRARRET